MKLIHITAKKYPGSTADHHYIENLAKGFYSNVGSNFTFIVCNTDKSVLLNLPLINLSIPSFVKRTIFFFIWIPFFYIKFPKKVGEQVVFFTNDQNLLSILILWKKILRFQYIVTADWHMLSQTWRDKFIAKNADHSIATSLKLEKAVRKLSPYSDIHTIYGGVDLKSYEIKENKIQLKKELQLPTDKFLVGYVGLFMTMGMEKGIETMIEALKHTDKDCIMVFVGGKPKEIESYKEQARSIGVIDNCLFLLIQSFDKVVKYEKAMDVLVIPYPDKPHFRSYGFPMKIYEYMASGIPTIYTKLELLEEVVSDCAYGIMPDSALDLAKTIGIIKSNPKEAEILASKAFGKVEKYTWQERARNILNVSDIIST